MKLRIHPLHDPFIGVGCRLPEENWLMSTRSPFSIHVELLLFGIVLSF